MFLKDLKKLKKIKKLSTIEYFEFRKKVNFRFVTILINWKKATFQLFYCGKLIRLFIIFFPLYLDSNFSRKRYIIYYIFMILRMFGLA